MGDSRKYPYYTAGGILGFRGRGGVSWTGILKTWGGGGVFVVDVCGRGGGGGVTQFGIFGREIHCAVFEIYY